MWLFDLGGFWSRLKDCISSVSGGAGPPAAVVSDHPARFYMFPLVQIKHDMHHIFNWVGGLGVFKHVAL